MRYRFPSVALDPYPPTVEREATLPGGDSAPEQPSSPMWMLRRRWEVARCTLTSVAGHAVVLVEIESPELPIVIVQRCPRGDSAQSAADIWRDLLLERGWREQPPDVYATPKMDRRRSVRTVQ